MSYILASVAVVVAALACSANAAIDVVEKNALAAPPARLGAKDWSGFCYSLRTEKIGTCNADIKFCKHVNSDTWQNPHPLYSSEVCRLPAAGKCSSSSSYASPTEPSEQVKNILIAGAIQAFKVENPNCTASN